MTDLSRLPLRTPSGEDEHGFTLSRMEFRFSRKWAIASWLTKRSATIGICWGLRFRLSLIRNVPVLVDRLRLFVGDFDTKGVALILFNSSILTFLSNTISLNLVLAPYPNEHSAAGTGQVQKEAPETAVYP